MIAYLPLVLRNMLRNRRRSALTVASTHRRAVVEGLNGGGAVIVNAPAGLKDGSRIKVRP